MCARLGERENRNVIEKVGEVKGIQKKKEKVSGALLSAQETHVRNIFAQSC